MSNAEHQEHMFGTFNNTRSIENDSKFFNNDIPFLQLNFPEKVDLFCIRIKSFLTSKVFKVQALITSNSLLYLFLNKLETFLFTTRESLALNLYMESREDDV